MVINWNLKPNVELSLFWRSIVLCVVYIQVYSIGFMFTPGGHRTCIGSNVELSIHFEKNLRTPAFRRSQKVSHFYWFYNTFFSHRTAIPHRRWSQRYLRAKKWMHGHQRCYKIGRSGLKDIIGKVKK
jgi:hypothetical protein